MTSTVVEIEAVEEQDFEIPCNARKSRGCENPAKWVFRMKCCGHISFYCTPCKDREVKTFHDIFEKWFAVMCVHCKDTHGYAPIVEPI